MHQKSSVMQSRSQSISFLRLARIGRSALFSWRMFVFVWIMVLVGVVIFFAVVGWDYYRLPFHERDTHPLDDVLRSRGFVGHALGLIWTVMILANFTYLLRRRKKIFKHGSLDRWLDLHMLTGITAWIVLSFHSSFHISRVLAVAYYGLFLVVVTGLIGRYIYSHIPKKMGGFIKSLRHISKEYESLSQELLNMGAPYDRVIEMIDASQYVSVIRGKEGFRLLPRLVRVDLRHLRVLFRVRRFLKKAYVSEPETYEQVWWVVRQMARDAYWIAIIKAVQNLMAKWRVLHRYVAWLLVFLFFCHMILVYLFLGREVFVTVIRNTLPFI